MANIIVEYFVGRVDTTDLISLSVEYLRTGIDHASFIASSMCDMPVFKIDQVMFNYCFLKHCIIWPTLLLNTLSAG